MGHDCARSRYRAAVAVELRMAGAEYQEIAKELGYADKSGAWRAVQRSLRSRQVTAIDRYRITRYAELEAGHKAAWPAARIGDIKAVERCLNIADARVRLLELR
jgi:hypothetical protein